MCCVAVAQRGECCGDTICGVQRWHFVESFVVPLCGEFCGYSLCSVFSGDTFSLLHYNTLGRVKTGIGIKLSIAF